MEKTIYKERGKAPCGARKLAGAGCLLLAGVLAAGWLVGHLVPEVPGAARKEQCRAARQQRLRKAASRAAK